MAKEIPSRNLSAQPGHKAPELILLVDDNAQVRQIMRNSVEAQTEWKVIGEAEDGAEAIKKAKELAPTCILLDFLMPNMNGIEAASVLKKMLPNSRIVLFTMFDEALGHALSTAAGVDLIISKPDGMTALIKSVERMMESGSMYNPHIARAKTA